MENLNHYIELIAEVIEALGVVIISLGSLLAFIKYFRCFFTPAKGKYLSLRQDLGKAILLGLEILVAADIIATVVTEPTLDKVLILGLIVLIRTFLSLSLQVELEGKFPWQQKNELK